MLAGPLYEVLSKLGVTDAAGKVESLSRGATQIIRMSIKTPDDWPGDEKKLYSYEVECPSLVAKKDRRSMWAHTVWEFYPLNVPFIVNFLPRIINVLAARFLPRGTLELAWCMLNRGIPGCYEAGKLDGSGIFVSHSAALQASLLRTIIDHFKRNCGSIEASSLMWILLVKAWSKKEWAKVDKCTIPDTSDSLDEASSVERKLAIQIGNFEEGRPIEVHLDCPRSIPLKLSVFSQITFRLPTYSFASEQKSGWFLYSLANPVCHTARISFALDTNFTPLVQETGSIHVCSRGNEIGLVKQPLCPDSSLTPPSYDQLLANVYEVRIEFLRPTSNTKHRTDVLSHLALITMLTLLFGPGSLANTVRPTFIPEHYPRLKLKSTYPRIVYDEYDDMAGLFDGSKGDQSQDYIPICNVNIKNENVESAVKKRHDRYDRKPVHLAKNSQKFMKPGILSLQILLADKIADRLKNRVPFDTDALLFKTLLSSAIYYLPQDLAVLGTFIYSAHRQHCALNPMKLHSDPNEALQSFARTKNLSMEQLKVRRQARKRLWTVDFQC